MSGFLLTKSERDDITRRMAALATKTVDEAAKSAQVARSHKYHIAVKDGGNVTKPGEWADVPDSEFGDPVNYRYPMPDKKHADNAASRWGDESNRSQYSSEEQKIIGDRITARQRHFGESMNKEEQKSADATELQQNAVTPEISETPAVETGDVTPELTLAAKKPADEKPAEDGDGDEDGDKEDDEEDGDGDEDDKDSKKKPAKDEDENADRFVGPPMEEEKAPAKGKKSFEANPHSEALLASYNTLGAALGLEPVELGQKQFQDERLTEMRTLVTGVEATVEKMLGLLAGESESEMVAKSGASLSAATKERLGHVHDVLAALAGGVHCAAVAMPQQNSAEDAELLQKRGASVSRSNMAAIGKAHDTLAQMCAGMHCADYVARHSDAPAQMAEEEAAEKSADSSVDVVAKFDKLSESFEAMAKSFGDLKTLRDEAETVRNEIVMARKSLGELKNDAAEIEDNMRFYGNQPTKRPTQITGRSIPEGTAVDFAGQSDTNEQKSAEPTAIEPKNAEEARAMAKVEYLSGVGRVRVWSKGFATNVRPSLEPDEMSLMSAMDILSYYNGGEVRVPVIG